MRRIGLAMFVMFFAGSCEPDRLVSPSQPSLHNGDRVKAADAFTARYARSRLSAWNIRASAAGDDCSILLVETPIIMEDSMVESMHYGAGAYDVNEGGVQQFSRDRTFRGVAYKDGSGRLWTYGALTQSEAEALKQCH
jgi:hypothetical protein